MKLHRLELRGIGPFASRFSIDFDRLSVAGIYLLDGPTGSGKSTIIDAITWALYGSVAGGDDSTSDRIRSTHSDPHLESYVDLVFTVNAGTYRVRRTPAWTKAGNKNPTAVTAKLWKLYDGALDSGDIEAGVVLETKASGAGIAITELIGLSRKQFVQTIVLPQGKFAEFLRLNSTERTALLEQIFGTEIYRKVAEKLAAMAGSANQAIERGKQEFVVALGNLLEAAGASGQDHEDLMEMGRGLIDPSGAAALLEELDGLRDLASNRRDVAATAQQTTAATLAQAQDSLRREQDLAEHLDRRSKLLERRTALTESTSEIEELERRLQADRRARQVLARVETAEEAERAADVAREELLEASGIAPEEATEAALAALEHRVREMNSLSGTLAELERLEESLSQARDEQSRDRADLEGIERQLHEAEKSSQSLPEKIAAARRAQEAAASSFAALPGAEANLRDAEARGKKAARLTELRKDIERAESSTARRLRDLQDARGEHDRLTEAWIASTAANLALELEDDSPCPVCGSLEHPLPAVKSEVFATHEEVREAEGVRHEREAELNAAQTALETLRATASAVEADIAGITVEEAQRLLAHARKEVKAAEKAGVEAATHARAISELSRQQENIGAQLARLREQATTATTRLAERGTRIAADEARLEQQLHGFASAAERLVAHKAALAAQNREVEAVRSWLSANRTAEARQQELAEALVESVFSNPQDVRAALVPPSRVTAWEAKITQHKQESHDVARDLNSPEIAVLTGEEEPRVPQARQAQVSALEQDEEARAALATADVTLRQVAARTQNVRERLQSWERAKETAGPVVRLAGLANASSEYSFTKMTLPTYVLSQRFKLVVEQANRHLAVFSLGRYELISTEEREKGSRAQKVGLGLEIIDHIGDADGDVRRATKSLSGGETFYVSLSLALALADVVCSENGGIQLETLMIDEGFGSLDENTRDQVMEVLTSLASGGRTVAVVSHVEELKKMISEQIVVRPQADGSSTLEVRA
ncbi:SMC family ATPase [Actinomycetaceae bacterium L2_0104]